jgi:prenyltransferase beta subunit
MDEYRGGGFSKLPEMYPDILHTFYSLAWLSMSEEVSERRTSEASPLPSPPASVVATGSDAVTGMIEPGSEGEVAMHALGKCNLRPLDIRLCICADRVPAHMQPAYTASSQLDL